jgi:hypothetical protein
MSASSRFKRWLGKAFSSKHKEPETPPSEAPERPVRRLKSVEEEVALTAPPGSLERSEGFSVHEIPPDVTHVCYDTKKITRPSLREEPTYDDSNNIVVPPSKQSTDRIKNRGYILKKDPVTRKIKRVNLEDVGDSPSKVIYYDNHGKLLD